MNSGRHSSGFTLTELLIVVAIAGILAAIAMPGFQSLTQSQQVKNASFELFSSLTLARSEAIKRNNNVTVTPVDAGDWGKGWAIQDLTKSPTETVRSQAALKGVSIADGPSSMIYSRTGRAAASASFEIDVSGNVTPNIRCVSIDLSGMPRTAKGACS